MKAPRRRDLGMVLASVVNLACIILLTSDRTSGWVGAFVVVLAVINFAAWGWIALHRTPVAPVADTGAAHDSRDSRERQP